MLSIEKKIFLQLFTAAAQNSGEELPLSGRATPLVAG